MRRGDWIQTYTGKKFWPLAPQEEDINIEDIAHSLSLICRFNGHCNDFYSVAQHSISAACELLISNNSDKKLALAGLLHDATEAYVCDVPRPIKPYLDNYKEIEDAIMHVIAKKYDITYPFDSRIKEIDNVLLATEARDLMGHDCLTKWNLPYKPLAAKVTPLDPKAAKVLFLRTFDILT